MSKKTTPGEALFTAITFLACGWWIKGWMDGNLEKAEQAKAEEAQVIKIKEQLEMGPPLPPLEWMPADGHFWSGVKLYYGPKHWLVGEILGGNDNHVDPLTGQKFRGVKIRYPKGSEEWKDRDAIILDDRWQVRSDDPAIAAEEWREYAF